MTFEQWWQVSGTVGPRDEAIARSAWRAATYAMNQEQGIAANEAAKDARRKTLIKKLEDTTDALDWYTETELDDIIKEAQG